MPATTDKTFPKAIDLQWSIFVSSYTGGDYLNIALTVYEDYNLSTTTWANQTVYGYSLNCNNLNTVFQTDPATGEYKYVEVSSGNISVGFSRGEYVDLNGDVVDPNTFYGAVIAALGV